MIGMLGGASVRRWERARPVDCRRAEPSHWSWQRKCEEVSRVIEAAGQQLQSAAIIASDMLAVLSNINGIALLHTS